MLVTDDELLEGRDVVEVARAAERGGVTSVQLRLKRASAREQVALARALVAELRVPVLVNDRPDVALASGAAGVHLGSEDLPVALVRRIAPAGFVIGASVGSEAEAADRRRGGLLGHRPLESQPHQAGRGRGARPRGIRRAGAPLGRTGRALRSGRYGRRMSPRCSRPVERAWRWCPVFSGEADVEAAARRYLAR